MTPVDDRRPSRLASEARRRLARGVPPVHAESQWRRVTFTLPRQEARAKAREFLARFPKAAYMTEVESWRVLDGDRIEFTMRRLPTAD